MEEWDYKKEVARKGVHLLSLLFVVIYIFFGAIFGHRAGLLSLAFLLVVLIEIEYVRIELKKKIPLISLLWRVKRAKERHRLGGEVFFLIGSIICLAIFDLRVAVAAILMTTFGDMASCFVGKIFGKTWIGGLKNKAWEGAIAEFAVNVIVGLIIVRTIVNGTVWWLGGSSLGQPVWPVILVMALVATAVETAVQKMDDNLLVPVFAGFAGEVTLIIISIFF